MNIMEGNILILADAFLDSVKKAGRVDQLSARDILLAATIALGIAIGLFVWAYLRFQNRRRARGELIEGPAPTKRERSPEKSTSKPDSKSDSKSGSNSDGGHVRRRKHRRRREHRPTNPTLQQTGGLPPPRSDDQLPKY